MHFLKKYFWLIALLVSCSDKNWEDSNPLIFKEYISGFSSGYISVDDPIRVVLSSEVEQNKIEQISAQKLFDISPKVEGKLTFSQNQIQFVPQESLKPDTEYFVTFNVFRLFDTKDENLEKFRFRIRTHQAKFEVETYDLQSYSPEYYFLNVAIVSSDNIASDKVSDIIWANIDGQDLSIKTSSNGKSSYIPIIIDSIPTNQKAQTLTIEWNGKLHNIDSYGKTTLSIPSKDHFSVVRVYHNESDANSFNIDFSAPVDKRQDFRGLISVDGNSNFKYSVVGNTIKVFSENPFLETIKVSVFKGIKSTYGNKLSQNYTSQLTFEQEKPQIRFVRNGTILPSSQDLKVHFQSVNLKAVEVTISRIYQNNVLQFLQINDLNSTDDIYRVGAPLVRKIVPISNIGRNSLKKWSTHSIDLSHFIKPEPGAIYRVKIDFNRTYSLFCNNDLTPIVAENLPLPEDHKYYDDYYDSSFVWEEREDPCKDSYYHGKAITTNILATDLGIIAKQGQNNQYVIAVNNLLTTEPVSNADVELFDFQQQLLQKATTNKDGIAQFSLNKKAYFVVAKKENNTTYLNIDNGYSQSLSRYDVDGVELQKGRNGFIYTERGVWRPGDTISVGFILNDYANKLPENHPIKLTFTDPHGKVMQQIVKNSTAQNHYLFTLKTHPKAITGNWNCQIKVGTTTYQKNIKIETIKPNRLKIMNSLSDKFIKDDGAVADIQVNWLQGAIAPNTSVEVNAKFYPQKHQFSGYKDYTFENVSMPSSVEEIALYNGKTNDEGKASFLFNPLNIKQNAWGMLKVHFLTKANETGGDFSTDVSSATYSPYESYVGIKAPEPNRYGYYQTQTPHFFEAVVLSQDAQPKSNRKVNLYVYKMDNYWWWDASYSNIPVYSSSDSHTSAFKANAITDQEGKVTFEMELEDEHWGTYFLLVEDEQSGHQAGIPVRFDWSYGTRQNNDASQSAMLTLSTDKKEYSVSERINLVFPSDEGRAFISVENGTKVLQTHWVSTQKGETHYTIPITEDMAPNAYIYVTLLQPHAQTANDAPIRLYGIAPVSVYNPQTKIEPIILMDDVLRPQKKTTLKIKEKSGKDMVYTLAVVEDGLLDLTRFRTPQPWDKFFAKTALGVKTWDVYNDVIGAFAGAISQVLSIGGDEDLGAGQAKKANRFNPLVIVKGPFYSDGGTQSHQITIPNYVGSARVMVIASDVKNNAYGSAEKSVPVKSPLMILGSLPRKAVVGENITLPVSVFASEKHIKNVSVKVKTNAKFQLMGSTSQELTFSEPSEKMAYFDLKVNQLGVGKVTIEATSGQEKTTYEVEMDIINPNPRVYQVKNLILQPNQSADVSFEVFGDVGSNTTNIEVSSFPSINLNQRLKYLIEYPHGCAEQITSGAFPQLYLSDFSSISEEQRHKIQKNISLAIQKLAENQLPNGGFAYWKGNSYADQWATSYIGQFYIEAEKRGFALPINSKSQWINFQKTQARNWQSGQSAYQTTTQAYRLYTLALANEPDMVAMNRLRESPLSSEARRLLATTYALVGQKRIAETLFSKTSFDDSETEYPHTYGSITRSQAFALETAMLLAKDQIAVDLATKISQTLSSSDWLSTQTTAYSLYVMSKYISKNKSGKDWTINYTIGKNKANLETQTGFASKEISLEQGEHTARLQNKSGYTLYARIITSGILPIGKELSQENGIAIQNRYTDNQGIPISVTNLTQGTSFVNTISVTNLTQSKVDNIALTQFIPSGWEIINTRFTDYTNDHNSFDYSDIRDDRSLLYFSLNAGQTKTFRIQLNASYLGKYYLPGTHAEAMYNQRYNTRTKGEWISVER